MMIFLSNGSGLTICTRIQFVCIWRANNLECTLNELFRSEGLTVWSVEGYIRLYFIKTEDRAKCFATFLVLHVSINRISVK